MTQTKRETTLYYLIPILISLFAWSAVFGFFIWRALGAGFGYSLVKDTLSTSNLIIPATHVVSYTATTSTSAGSVAVKVTFDPLTDRFGGVANVTSGAMTSTGMLIVGNSVGSCSAVQNQVFFTTSSGAGDESISFTVCPTVSVATGTKTLTISNVITNPTTTNSYIIRLSGTNHDTADTRVAILSDVLLTASVDTIFTFTVSGAPTGTTINGVTTTRASASTTLNFGTLPVGSPVTMGQLLNVQTNARNGFVVTVFEDQNPLSATGADIDLFKDANATSTPSAWVAPANTLTQENTFGHIGLTSDDSDLNAGEFGSGAGLFVGNFNSTNTRQVFSATGSADGTTPNTGSSSVAFRIQIGSLQEAATDYTNRLTYVATPTF